MAYLSTGYLSFNVAIIIRELLRIHVLVVLSCNHCGRVDEMPT